MTGLVVAMIARRQGITGVLFHLNDNIERVVNGEREELI